MKKFVAAIVCASLLLVSGVASAEWPSIDTGFGFTNVPYNPANNSVTAESVFATSIVASPKTITITNATNATPIIVTAVAHGLLTDDRISISGITGNTNANGYFKILKMTNDTFALRNYSTGADIVGNGAYGGVPIAVTGIVQANRVLVGDGTAAVPSVAFGSAPTTGFYISGANIGLSFSGATKHGYNTSVYSIYDNSAALAMRAGSDSILTFPAAATLQLGAANSATHAGVAQTLQVQSNITETDQNSPGDWTLNAARGTGTGTSGKFIFQAGTPGTTSGTAHVLAPVLTLANGGSAGTALPQVQVASAGQFGFSTDTIVTRKGAANPQLGAADAASPVAQTLSMQSVVGGTSNVAGTAFTLKGSLQTGNAQPGTVLVQAGAMAASGTTQATAITRNVHGYAKILTNNSAIAITNMTNASNTAVGVNITYGIEVFNGTDVQYEQGEAMCMVTNKAGAWSGNTCTKHGNQQNMSSGTLTVTFAVTGANPAVVSVNANSSLTPNAGYPRIFADVQVVGNQVIAMQ